MICARCGYIASTNQNYAKHLKRKKICNPILSDISVEELKKVLDDKHFDKHFDKHDKHFDKHNKNYAKHHKHQKETLQDNDSESIEAKQYSCKYCQKTFQFYQSRWRHEKKCGPIDEKPKSQEINQLQNQINEIKQERDLMKNELEKLVTKLETYETTPPNPSNISYNMEQVNINITNNFGNENTEYITEEYVTKLIQNGIFGSIPKLMKQIHFNPNHPENINVKITNKKLNYASVFNNNKWELRDKREVLENIVDKGYGIIDDHYITIQNKLEEKYKQRYRNYESQFNNDNGQEKKNQIKKVELLVLNESRN